MSLDADVCVVGGGPAGMMLGFLLARDGVSTVVLEKHGDFLRDFRGDTVHPSTLDVMDQLGLGQAAADVPHRDVAELRMTFADGTYRVADFSRLRGAHPYIRFMPQWDFLNILANAAEALPSFRLLRRHEVVDVIREDGVVRGVRAETPTGPVEVRARLTVAADGRGSVVRAHAGLRVREYGAPMDVLWFRVGRDRDDAEGLDMHLGPRRLMLAIDRGEYWQIAYVVAKGDDERWRQRPIEDLRRSVADLVPTLGRHVSEVQSWADVRTLTVRMDRLRRWHAPGLLCIGDAAHAMSPVGGVGINLAIQDAVCAARVLTEPLRAHRLDSHVLASVQARRALPTMGTQLGQRLAQRFLVGPVLAGEAPVRAPAPMKLLARFPALQALPARVVGVGIRPEHVPETRRHV
ncbi:MAG TPA: FAD-dependent oxidoreductase [Nocardioidaceae bacterium]|nr:FAD-dependent oxidoreductase [Nocardioidaceae bacterium]